MKRVYWFYAVVVLMIAVVGGAYLYADKEWHDVSELTNSDVKGRFIQTGIGRTYYELEGPTDGELVVLVHGFSVPSFLWEPTQKALLKEGFRVLAMDLFGRGYSDRPHSDYGMTLYVEQLNDLLQALDIKKPVNLVGISMGGAVVTHFTNSYPNIVKKISLLAPLIETPSRQEMKFLKLPLLGNYLAKVAIVPSLQGSLGKVVNDTTVFPDWEEKFSVQTTYRGFASAILTTARYLDGKSFEDEYKRLSQKNKPTQLFWGRNDQIINFSDSEKVLNALGDIEFIPLDNTGHLPHYEQPEIVNARLIEFLRKD
jgi:pimeloyl-ACP methyl ester carboxylesterase